jgi:hypothetical protein
VTGCLPSHPRQHFIRRHGRCGRPRIRNRDKVQMNT